MKTRTLCVLQTCPVFEVVEGPDAGRVYFKADADIDADGANGQTKDDHGQPLPAYTPNNRGLDDLMNARDGMGGWCGIVVIGGRPAVQPGGSYAPGAYISKTALLVPNDDQSQRAATDPDKYVDSAGVPFIVVSPTIAKMVEGVVLGCRARVTYRGKSVDCVVADIGPTRKIGELSIAAAKAVGIPSSARTGGIQYNIVDYELWPDEPAVVNGHTYVLQKLSGQHVFPAKQVASQLPPPSTELNPALIKPSQPIVPT